MLWNGRCSGHGSGRVNATLYGTTSIKTKRFRISGAGCEGGYVLVNLFQWQAEGAAAIPGALAGALAALLEHSDRRLLRSFLQQAGLDWQPEEPLQFRFPAEGGPGMAEVVAPGRWRVLLLSRVPVAPWDPAWVDRAAEVALAGPETGRVVVVAPAARRPADSRDEAVLLSWEQVDRWLEQSSEEYPADSRTAFLIDQFRNFLPSAGLTYFGGFDPEDLSQSSRALGTLQRLTDRTAQFFGHLEPVLREAWPELVQARAARPEDLLAGYLYRDYTLTNWGSGAFLRVAVNLGREVLEVSCWLTATGEQEDAHARLRQEPAEVLSRLSRLDGLLVRLWQVGGEQQIPVTDVDPAAVNWGENQVGFQVEIAFAEAGAGGLVERVVEMAEAISAGLGPVLVPPREVH